MKNDPAIRSNGPDRQRAIYLPGVSGQRPLLPTNAQHLETLARTRMSAKAFGYVAGSAGRESTADRNVAAFESWRIRPRMLRDVSQRDPGIRLFGRSLPGPFLLAPIGVLDLAAANGDLAVARAAARMGVPMIFSNQASAPMEDCAAVMGDSPRWFQLYWSKSNDLVASLVGRAEACGCEAIVVTLDTTLLGWRPRDLDLAFLPFLQGRGIAQYVSDPVFQRLMDEPAPETQPSPPRRLNWQTLRSVAALMRRYPGSVWQNLRSGRPLKAVRTFINTYSRPSLSWEDLPFLRQQTSLPILLKGVLHPDDARRAIDAGVDGLLVSNHGGRQLDGAIASVEALPSIVEAVAGQAPILLDSGIRSGADAFKALALGAKAVCIGRPYVYSLAIAGQAGVEELLSNFFAEFDLTMGLAGCRNVEEIDHSTLWQAG